ncbi:MAG: hypothetical protein Q9170_007549 [Blastenia crenularia]
MASHTVFRPLWLLLLPSPPEKVTLNSIEAAYASLISQVLQKSADVSLSLACTTVIDIALPCSEVYTSDTIHYSYLQNLLGQLYSLICLLCTEQSIDVQYGNDVDVRILLVQASSLGGSEHPPLQAVDGCYIGPIVSLQTLACCNRLWQRICSPDNEIGEVQLQLFLRLRNVSLNEVKEPVVVERIPPNSSSPTADVPASVSNEDDVPRTRHNAVAVGGTFDHLHAGHKLLLSMTALVLSLADRAGIGEKRSITVGITGDKLLENKKFRHYLQDWHQRQAAVQAFLQAFLVVDKLPQQDSSDQGSETDGTQQREMSKSWPSGLVIHYVEIFDAFGPTITDEAIAALVLSQETRAGGMAVNEKRAKKNWPALDIFEVDVLDTSDRDVGPSDETANEFQNKISSTEIRRRLGEKQGTTD